MSGIYNADMRT